MANKKPKRQPAHLPTYDHPRSSYAGISERLALASLAYSKTWKTTTKEHGLKLGLGSYMHTVRYIGKKDGWEARLTWTDNLNRVNVEGVSVYIAQAIEGARAAYHGNKHPSPALTAILANVAGKAA